MINQPILRHWRKGFTFLQQPRDHPYAILQQGRIRGMMNIGVNSSGVESDGATLLGILASRRLDENSVHCFPGRWTDGLDVFLQGGITGILPHLKPGKSPEGGRILQMKGQLLIGQLPILFQNGATQNLLGTQTKSSGICLPQSDKILIDQFQNFPIVIQDSGYRFQFLANFIPWHNVMQFPLKIS